MAMFPFPRTSVVAKRLTVESLIRGNINDDFINTLNHLWTVTILMLFTIVVTFTEIMGPPIHCLAEPHYPQHRIDYIDSYCWVSNTYFIDDKSPIPEEKQTRWQHEVAYYQWTPAILMAMMFFFKIPDIVWKFFNESSGINLKKLIPIVDKTFLNSSESHQLNISGVAHTMDRWLEVGWIKQENKRHVCPYIYYPRSEGNFFPLCYVCVKVLYLTNIILQFFILNVFLGKDLSNYVFNFLEGKQKEEHILFPYVTFCDFHVRQLQNIQHHTVQCFLSLNYLLEKIFVFLWCWMFIVAIATSINFIIWIYRFFYSQNIPFANPNDHMYKQFIQGYLRKDGIFILRLIGRKTAKSVLEDLVEELWQIYQKRIANSNQSKNFNHVLGKRK